MAVAFVSEFDVEPGDRSTTSYDAVTAELDPAANPPQGLLLHTAGFHGDVFRVFDVWDNAADAERFYADRLMPLVMRQDAEGGGPPTRQYSYDLHDVHQP